MEDNQTKRLKDLWKCAHRRLAKRKSKIKAQKLARRKNRK